LRGHGRSLRRSKQDDHGEGGTGEQSHRAGGDPRHLQGNALGKCTTECAEGHLTIPYNRNPAHEGKRNLYAFREFAEDELSISPLWVHYILYLRPAESESAGSRCEVCAGRIGATGANR